MINFMNFMLNRPALCGVIILGLFGVLFGFVSLSFVVSFVLGYGVMTLLLHLFPKRGKS